MRHKHLKKIPTGRRRRGHPWIGYLHDQERIKLTWRDLGFDQVAREEDRSWDVRISRVPNHQATLASNAEKIFRLKAPSPDDKPTHILKLIPYITLL